jgi:hypothetical protein
MAINACTINDFTIDGRRCSDKFSRLIPILHPPTVVGTNPRVLRDNYQVPRPFDFEKPDERPTWTFEQPFITVTVELDGVTGNQTLDVSAPQLDFVTVTNFSIHAAGQVTEQEELITVNITDFKV